MLIYSLIRTLGRGTSPHDVDVCRVLGMLHTIVTGLALATIIAASRCSWTWYRARRQRRAERPPTEEEQAQEDADTMEGIINTFKYNNEES